MPVFRSHWKFQLRVMQSNSSTETQAVVQKVENKKATSSKTSEEAVSKTRVMLSEPKQLSMDIETKLDRKTQ